jgi:hypothetical protein
METPSLGCERLQPSGCRGGHGNYGATTLNRQFRENIERFKASEVPTQVMILGADQASLAAGLTIATDLSQGRTCPTESISLHVCLTLIYAQYGECDLCILCVGMIC